MQVHRERICRFCKKLLNPPQGKRVPVVSVFNRLKNKELIAASGQESVVLAAEIGKLRNCLHRGDNFPYAAKSSRNSLQHSQIVFDAP